VLSIAGIFIGSVLSTKTHADQLRTSFGWFVLVMGLYIFTKEIFFA
jgi:uncharacterized protein